MSQDSRENFGVKTQISTGAWRGGERLGEGGWEGRGEKERKDRKGMLRAR